MAGLGFENLIVVVVLGFLGLIVWSRVMGQSMSDTFREIKDLIGEIQSGE